MKKGLFRTFLCIILALLMGLGSPLMSIAEEQDGLYLADLKIGYGDDGKASLESKGYKVYNQNANETGQGSAVYIGYKTTNKTEEAITDIATMNMNGRYSFDKYAKYLQEVQEAAANDVKQFISAVKEFEGIVKDKTDSEISEIAKIALNFLNKYYDDDFADANDSEVNKIGNMIKDGKMTEDVLTKLFYQSNSEIISAIKRFIAIGITETGTDTFLTRLQNFEYKDQLTPSLAYARSVILDWFEDTREYLLAAKGYADAAKASGGYKRYLSKFTDEDDKSIVIAYIGTYEAATSAQYSSNLTMPDGSYMTLYDALTLPTEDEYNAMEEEPECEYTMDAYMADIMAQAMTAGQIGCLTEFSPVNLIANTKYAGTDDDAKEAMETLVSEANACTEVSVYAGVDRSLFDHPEDVAMTASTIEEANKGGTNNIGRDLGFWETNKAVKISMATLGGIAFVATVAMVVTCAVRFHARQLAWAFYDEITQGGTVFVLGCSRNGSLAATTDAYMATTQACFITGAIAFAIFVICLIVFLVKAFEKPSQPTEFKYTKIPRALVHMVEGEENKKEYYNYYAVKRIDASEDDNDYMNVYGDLNGYSKTCQWECLYVTRDSRCGKPLSADIEFVTGSPDTSKNSSNGYLPIHDFDSDLDAASNLNAYTGSENPTAIYAYAKLAADSTANQGGSIFETNPVAMCVAALVVGAGLSCGATLLITKKRKTA